MNRSTAPGVKPFAQLRLPGETVEVLPNGLTFHRVSGGDQPVCRLTLMLAGGASEIGNDVTPRLMMKAMSDVTAKYPADTLADAIDFNGVRTGSACHGHYTSFSLAMLNHRVEDIMPLFASMLAEPVFPADRFESARLSAKAQIETSRREVSVLASEAFDTLMSGERHPLAHSATVVDIDQFTRDKAIELHRRILSPRHAHAFLSGLLDDRLVGQVREMLSAIPTLGSGIDIDIQPLSPVAVPTRVDVPNDESFQSAIAAGMPAIQRSHPDYIPLRLAVMALGGYFGSRLMTNIREEKGLTYGISAALIGSQEGSYVKIAAQCDKAFTEQVINETRKELTRLATDPPHGKELERLRLTATTNLAEILDTPASVMGYYSTRLLVDTPADYFAAQQKAISTLSSDTLARMAHTYLRPECLSIAVAGGK